MLGACVCLVIAGKGSCLAGQIMGSDGVSQKVTGDIQMRFRYCIMTFEINFADSRYINKMETLGLQVGGKYWYTTNKSCYFT